MSTPLTDSINALTAYANSVTGVSDTTLSDAVHSLASGFGGNEYSRTTLCPFQNFTVPSSDQYVFLTDAQRLVNGGHYIVTYDGDEYYCTATELWGSDRMLGDINLSWGNNRSDFITPFCVEDWNGNPTVCVYARDNNQHSIKIERLELFSTD